MKYIINFNPHTETNPDLNYLSQIETKIQNKESLTNEEASYFLKTIIFITRSKINPNLDNYDNKCDLAQSIIYYYFKNLNCNLYPAATQNVITNNIIGHSFIVLELIVENKIKYFLLDPTYIQFFKQDKCNENNYYVNQMYPNYILLTPDPGYFIRSDMKGNAIFLLNNGYIELTDGNAQMYGDSFYNTKTGTNPNTITYQSIPGEIYIAAFLKGKENISKTEEELLKLNLSIPLFKEQLSKKRKQ